MKKTSSLASSNMTKSKSQARQITLTKGFSGIVLKKNQATTAPNEKPKFMSPKKIGVPAANNAFQNEDEFTNATQFMQPMRVSASYENQKFKPSVKTKSAKAGTNLTQVSPAGHLLLEEMRKRDSENKNKMRSRNQEDPSLLYSTNQETFRVLRKKQSTVSNEQPRGGATQMSVKASINSVKPIPFAQKGSTALKFQKKREVKQMDKFGKINEMRIQNSGLSQLSMGEAPWDHLRKQSHTNSQLFLDKFESSAQREPPHKKQKSNTAGYNFMNPYTPKMQGSQLDPYNRMTKNFSDKSLYSRLMNEYQQGGPYHSRGQSKGTQMQATGSIFGNMRHEPSSQMDHPHPFTKMSNKTSMAKGKNSMRSMKKSQKPSLNNNIDAPSIYNLYQVPPQFPQPNIPRALDQNYRPMPTQQPQHMWPPQYKYGPMDMGHPPPQPQYLNQGSFFRPPPPMQQQQPIPEETPQRIPIQSLYPNLGYDYVYYKQADRIQKMRQKRRENNTLYSRCNRMVSGQIITNPKRKKIASRQKKALERKRDPKGRFYSKKELEEMAAQEQKDQNEIEELDDDEDEQ